MLKYINIFDDSIKIIIRKTFSFFKLVTSMSIKEVNKNSVTSKEVELGGKMTLM